MKVGNPHALNKSDIAELADIFDLLAQYDHEDNLKDKNKLGVNIGSLDPASKGPMLEPNKSK